MLHDVVQHRCNYTNINCFIQIYLIWLHQVKYGICIQTLLQQHICIGRWKGNRVDYCFNYILSGVKWHIKWRKIFLSILPRNKSFEAILKDPSKGISKCVGRYVHRAGKDNDKIPLSMPNINPSRRMPGRGKDVPTGDIAT